MPGSTKFICYLPRKRQTEFVKNLVRAVITNSYDFNGSSSSRSIAKIKVVI
jgi:hypothetical protein